MRVSMKYSDVTDLTSGVANAVSNVFRAFSIYDPDLTGTGHQPLGHDQMALLYQRYRVLGSKIDVYFYSSTTSQAATNTLPTSCSVVLTNESSSLLGTDEPFEQPIAKIGMCSLAENDQLVLKLPYNSSWKTTGSYGAKYEEDLSADFGSNPIRDGYYHVTCQRDGSANVAGRARVVITYDVWCYDPIQLSSS